MMRAAGGDNTAGLAQVIHAEVLAPWLGTAAGPAMLGNGAGGPTAVPLVPIGPLPPQNPATVYPFSKSAVLRRLLSDQVRVRGPRVLLVSDSFVRLLRPKLIRPYRSHPNT